VPPTSFFHAQNWLKLLAVGAKLHALPRPYLAPYPEYAPRRLWHIVWIVHQTFPHCWRLSSGTFTVLTMTLPKNDCPEISFSHLHLILVASPTLIFVEELSSGLDVDLFRICRLVASLSEQPTTWSNIRQVKMLIRPAKKTTRLEDRK